jgi:hypothetical protein
MMRNETPTPTIAATAPVASETIGQSDEGYSILIDHCNQSVVSSLSCSVCSYQTSVEEESLNLNMKRTRKAMDFSSYPTTTTTGTLESSRKRRRRGASYTIVEIHSLLHLMKRVLPKCADEWELIRMVHCRIFPDNDRTVLSLKKKFKDLCSSRTNNNSSNCHDLLDERFRAKPAFSQREVEKAREVQFLISEKPPGFQLVLPKEKRVSNSSNNDTQNQVQCPIHSSSNSNENHVTITGNSAVDAFPIFRVKVPDPLQPMQETTEPEHDLENENEVQVKAGPIHLQGQSHIPKFIQIPESPITNDIDVHSQSHSQPDYDEMSELDLNDYQEDFTPGPSIVACPLSPQPQIIECEVVPSTRDEQQVTVAQPHPTETDRGMMVSPYLCGTSSPQPPVTIAIIDSK